MADHGQRAAEEAQAKVARRLKSIYGEAVKDIDKQIKAYTDKYAKADIKMRAKLAEGKITDAQYAAWKRGQVFTGDLWHKKRDMLAGTMYDADVLAQRIINGERLNVFAENMNSMAYDMEHGEGVDMGFGYYDSSTVARLLAEDPDMLPAPKVKKDKDTKWYRSKVNNVVTKGIIMGSSIPDMASEIARETGEMAYKAALRNARTAMTGAQNAGRIEAMEQAQSMGIKVQKRWMSTLDGRTRDAHRDLDGQVQDVDKPFESDLGDIMFPGDPHAHPGNVYNCRCTLVYVHPKYPSDLPRRDQITGEVLEDMSYREWEGWKQTGKKPQRIKAISTEKFQVYQEDKYDAEYKQRLAEYEKLKADADSIYSQYSRLSRSSKTLDERHRLENEYIEVSRKSEKMRRDIQDKYGIESLAAHATSNGIDYVPLKKSSVPFDPEEVIERLAGGDMTEGSCASLAFCYVGQKAGYDVLDFRDGASRSMFASNCVDILKTLKEAGLETKVGTAKSYVTAGKRALAQAEAWKEYYFECGRHATIIRKIGDRYEYLELQSGRSNGWKRFLPGGVDKTLSWRFGATKSSGMEVQSYMVDVNEMAQSDRFKKILGFINTDENKQHKGASGHER